MQRHALGKLASPCNKNIETIYCIYTNQKQFHYSKFHITHHYMLFFSFLQARTLLTQRLLHFFVMRCHIENGKQQIRERNRLKKGSSHTYRLNRRQKLFPYLFTVHLKWNSFTGVLIVSSSGYFWSGNSVNDFCLVIFCCHSVSFQACVKCFMIQTYTSLNIQFIDYTINNNRLHYYTRVKLEIIDSIELDKGTQPKYQ